ncbi:armadillo repeat-containing protein 5 isoform X2 [Macrosteles quadrilineatus]|uniref:armadillo repeat-containing protein 5 isoform X2 n=1 Tax=Macrosteles quadrilineatus TaxID=74068 RepID=UPI0023E0B328|nr:armadillo repeat-containing protein 5 isoform X2 [Macrosteles quadrilineatus]
MSKTGQSVGIVKLISQLEKCSSQSVYKHLVQIRTDVIKDAEGVKLLRERGGLKHIVRLLNKPNEKILNVSLSILANCCLQEECRDQVVSYGAIPLIIPILKNINQDSIQSRACRLIGNLTQSYKIADKIHEQHITPVLVNVLNTSSSLSTQQMAIRALRSLWEVPKYRIEMLKMEAVKAVAFHIVSEDNDVKTAVLKALATFTTNLKSSGLAIQVQGGRSDLRLLVQETGETLANLCLYNLCLLDMARLQLVKDGLVEAVVTRLTSSIEHWLAMIFCLLCQDSIGRAHVRNCPGGLGILLKLLQSTKSKSIQAKAMKALNNFLYDDTSLYILLKNGLVATLIKTLAEFVSKVGRSHDKCVSVGDSAGSVSPCSSGMSPQYGGGAPGMWSPLSDDCSPRSSPVSVYSPLCLSEDELEPTPRLPDDDFTVQQKVEDDSGEVKEEEMILSFLYHITNYVSIPIQDFVNKGTISTLIDYISLVRDANPCAGRLLCNIAKNKNYYRQLLDDQFVLEVQCRLCRPNHESCGECARILGEGTRVLGEVATLAQTGLGEGEITYRLLKADTSVKLLVSLSIPHVISEKDLLLKLLFKRQAINYLMDALENKQDDAVASLHALFHTLNVKNPQQPTNICSHCNVGSLRKEGTITFLLDDGSTVSANKSTLCNNSPVFEAMFRGGFRESDQTEVKLTDISADCVTYFSRIIDTYCECILPKNIQTLLDLIVASDRFLVPDLATNILSVVMNHSLSYKTCCVVYDWALSVGYKYPMLGNIGTDVVKFALTSPMTPRQRVEAISFMLKGVSSLSSLLCPVQFSSPYSK